MVNCPNCKKIVESPPKKWNYYKFTVEQYKCSNCGVSFREYLNDKGKHSFTLMANGKNFRPVKWMTLSFVCPKCGIKALSVDKGETIENAGVSSPKHLALLKGMLSKYQMKKYRFWLCANNRCANYGVYYQTDTNGKLIKELHDH